MECFTRDKIKVSKNRKQFLKRNSVLDKSQDHIRALSMTTKFREGDFELKYLFFSFTFVKMERKHE